MTILRALQIAAAVITVVVGLVALLFPRRVIGFTGLEPLGGRGVTEIRAVLGALFVALGAAPLFLKVDATYRMLGIGYLAVGVVRAVSILVDKSSVASNWISLAFEVVLGVILVL